MFQAIKALTGESLRAIEWEVPEMPVVANPSPEASPVPKEELKR